jgi:NADH-quinone oxidoreductase subunit L
MRWPLVVLALFAIGVGFVGVPPGHGPLQRFLAPVFGGDAAAHGEGGVALLAVLSLGAALAGMGLATWLYWARPELPARCAARYAWVYRILWNKYHVDETYERLLVQPVRRASVWLWRGFDEPVIDGSVNGVGAVVQAASLLFRRLQTGYVMSYVLSFLAGVVLIVGYLALG